MSQPVRLILALGAAVFVGSILWSMVTETLLPLWRAGDMLGFWRHVVGMPIILAGTGLIVWGGYVFVRDTAGGTSAEEFVRRQDIINAGDPADDVSGARRAQLGGLWRLWRRGLAWLAVGFVVLAVGSVIINFPLPDG